MDPANPCIFMNEKDKMGDLLNNFKADQIFAAGLDTASDILPDLIQGFFRENTFIDQSPVWESPRAMILRKDFPKYSKRYVDFVISLMREFAFIDRAMRDFPTRKFFGKRLRPPLTGRQSPI